MFYGDDECRWTVGFRHYSLPSLSACMPLPFRNLFIANIRQSRIDAINLDKQYHTVVYSNHENETGIMRPIALDLDTTNG